ncbi:hypothetical protein [Flavobacterium sp.]|uniref:hypothetical protein n=1 Tax=Flavobacterium sp. TaxID=239 RepID=UPI004034BD67
MKTFEELGLTFNFESDCATCNDGSCHNTSASKIDGQEYFVHISTNKNKDSFYINASLLNANTDDNSEVFEYFDDEGKAVQYLCQNFEGFKCF